MEIQNLIADARHLDEDYRRVLKTIGTLNLVTTTGAVKATPELVTLALCDSPNDEEQQQTWDDIIDRLLRRNVITHRRLLDELRLWEGSDFNVEGEVAAYSEQERSRSPVKFFSTALFILRHKPNISELALIPT